MTKKMTALIIMDGFGERAETYGNAIKLAGTPNLDKLKAEYPHTVIGASGMDVGLPDGQMGNSEVGHLNIGAGRIVYQELTRITKSIQDGDFFKVPEFVDAWVRKGVTLLDLGDGFQAVTCLNEAVRLNPKSFKARYNRGKSYLQLKYYDEAVSDFMKAVDLKPKHAAAHEYLAEAFLHIGEEELARQHRDIADELRNENKSR